MIVYSVPDDYADNGTGVLYFATQKEAFEAARTSSKVDPDSENEGREIWVEKIWLIKPDKKGCVAMLNNLFFAEKSETIAIFKNGRRVKKEAP